MKVNQEKLPESALQKVNAEIESFYHLFAESIRNQFGYVSAKKLQEYVARI
jgi:hypothetical protein